MQLAESIKLPCGVVLKNRLAKSAMSENMAYPQFNAGDEFYHLYRRWCTGGLGLCISGNVMVDKQHLGEAHNIVIEKGLDNHAGLKNWARAGQDTNCQLWVQLNHPGKQIPNFISKDNLSPSAIPFAKPLDKMFSTPRELTEVEIINIIERFADAAKIVKDCGFSGVQIHGAHGYLVSQFLSGKSNQRTDQWGGSSENRMRFVVEVYKSMRRQVGADFPIGIKINSADFQKGGFTNAEAIQVAKKLSELGIDLIELSGGTYEKPAMTGIELKASTKKREAYFLEYAAEIKNVISCPLMVTGGFRTAAFMQQALAEKALDIIGLARPLAINPEFPQQLLAGDNVQSEVKPLTSGFKIIDTLFPLEIIWYTEQLHRIGHKKQPRRTGGVYAAIFNTAFSMGLEMLKRVRGQ